MYILTHLTIHAPQHTQPLGTTDHPYTTHNSIVPKRCVQAMSIRVCNINTSHPLDTMCTVDEQLNNDKSQSTAESQDSGTIVQYCQFSVSQTMSIRVCNISTSHPLDTMCTVDEQLNNDKSQSTAGSQDSGTIVQYCQFSVSQTMSIRVCNISTSHPLDTMCTVDEQLNNDKSQSTAESQDSGTIVQYCQFSVSQTMSIRVCNISTSHPLDTMCTVDEQLNNDKSQSTAESQDSGTIVQI
ncbi:hypothetical protein J6590_098368 [Homalodisca vitripennis]|nr:hypothetical protein J6590_098368 [Homalodisca vitripennis]